MKVYQLIVLSLTLIGTSAEVRAASETHTLKLDWQKPVPQLRWLSKDDPKATHPLTKIKEASSNEQFGKCLLQIPAAKQSHPELVPWLTLEELKCFSEVESKNLSEIQGVLNHGKLALAVPGPWSEDLREKLFDLYFYYLKSSKKEIRNWVSGELSAEASLYHRLSQAQKKLLYESVTEPAESAKSTNVSEVSVPNDPKVQKKFEKVKALEREGKRFAAGKDALSLIEKYPLSEQAKDLESLVYKVYRNLDSESEKKRLLDLMGKAPPPMVFDWADNLSSQAKYSEAIDIHEVAVDRLNKAQFNAEMTLSLAKRMHLAGQYKEAVGRFNEVCAQGPNSTFCIEAKFHQALSHLRLKEFKEALEQFESVLKNDGSDAETYHMTSLYWSYRAHEELNLPKSDRKKWQKKLQDKYPFTYYSLLLQGETSGGNLTWPVEDQSISPRAEITLLPIQHAAWKRALALLEVGWFDEAWSELQELPEITTSEQKVLYSRYLASAMAYPAAMRLLNEAWDEDPRWRSKDVVRLAYPIEFASEISEGSKENELSEVLVRSLIRQESGFFFSAISRSKAIGLMQLMAPTAREVLGWMGLSKKHRVPQDVFHPELNVRLGTRYLGHVAKQFNSHIPLALASYNAGPTRIKRWIKSREDTAPLLENKTWTPWDDLWLDELPWGEPRFYVKAILRNAMIYQLLAQKDSPVKLESPVWKDFHRK